MPLFFYAVISIVMNPLYSMKKLLKMDCCILPTAILKYSVYFCTRRNICRNRRFLIKRS